jgi:glycine cleavage system regulatory protein
VVLLSDGQAEGIATIQPYIEKMKKFVQLHTSSAEFHTLGFGSGHDAAILSAIPNSGTSQGTFQYIKSASEIQQAMEAVSGFFGQSNLGGLLNYGKTEAKIFLDGDDDPFADDQVWNGFTYLDMNLQEFEKVKDTFFITLSKGKAKEIIQFHPKQEEIDDLPTKIKLNLQSLNHQLKKITAKLSTEKVSAEEAEALTGKTNDYRKNLEQISRDIFKLKIALREPLFAQVGDLTEYLNAFSGLLNKNFLGQLNNEQIANLNSLAYRDVTRKALLKKLDKRATKAVPIINEAFEKVHNYAKDLNQGELESKYNELVENTGTCMLTCYNFVEAMGDEDCLCLTFDLNRPEIAIADCTRIQIKQIYPTIMSAKSFMDSAKYSIKLNAKASGGFSDDEQGRIIKGVSNEDITGVLPLFICPEHWKIAALLMKPILGWVITLDPVGYSYFQKKVFPFMLLGHALKMKDENPEGQFVNRIHDSLLDVCTQIVRDDSDPDFGGTFVEDVTKIFNGYLDDGSLRTLDSVQSNFVHLAHCYVLWKMGTIQRPQR